jgi:hypothetical protein
MTNMISGASTLIPTADYDALLLRLAATVVNTGVTLTVTNSNYTIATAQAARDYLTDDLAPAPPPNGLEWTVNDAGGI